MAKVTFYGVCEGKLSIWNKELNTGGGTAKFITVCYLFGGYDKCTAEIKSDDLTSFVMVQIPSFIIESMTPTEKTITFVGKDNKKTDLLLNRITVNDESNFALVVLNKNGSTTFKRAISDLGPLNNLIDDELKNRLTSLSEYEVVNDTVSRPICRT